MTPDSPPKPRRFYTSVEVVKAGDAFAVRLDGRSAKSPGGAPLAAPTAALAELIADEWRVQAQEIDFASMPLTRLAFTTLDRGAEAHAGMADEVARYASADLLCYLAEAPQALAEREAALWGPWIAWAEETLGVKLSPSFGISPARQPEASLERARALADALDDFSLTALTMACGLYGSAVLAFAVHRDALAGEAAFELSRVDEAFQEAQWGVDAEAQARTESMRAEAMMLDRWFAALRD